jgi:ABC-type proline/glycine betaine transport system permease subunit
MGFLLQLVSRNEIAGVTEVSDELRERATGAGVGVDPRLSDRENPI